STFRRAGFLVSANYSYDRRYLLDATYRIDGSTAFGSSKVYSPFWSVGLGWNVQNESFFNLNAINVLRLKTSYGITGNENFGSVSSLSTYMYKQGTSIYGQGVIVDAIGNPNLEWQQTTQMNVGVELVMFHNRVNTTSSAFKKLTDPLVVYLDEPTSTGIGEYPANAGSLNTRGIEADVRVLPIR